MLNDSMITQNVLPVVKCETFLGVATLRFEKG